MSMFDNYTNLNPNAIPYNISIDDFEKRVAYTKDPPYIVYDSQGKFIGYSWNYGEIFTLLFHINPVIKVEQNALIYDNAGEIPSAATAGVYGQRAYNTVDLKTWICKTYDQSVYDWQELEQFTYPLHGSKEITLHTINIGSSDIVNISILNFRMETIYSTHTPIADTVAISIDDNISKSLLKGIYYCTVDICEDIDSDITHVDTYTLIVK